MTNQCYKHNKIRFRSSNWAQKFVLRKARIQWVQTLRLLQRPWQGCDVQTTCRIWKQWGSFFLAQSDLSMSQYFSWPRTTDWQTCDRKFFSPHTLHPRLSASLHRLSNNTLKIGEWYTRRLSSHLPQDYLHVLSDEPEDEPCHHSSPSLERQSRLVARSSKERLGEYQEYIKKGTYDVANIPQAGSAVSFSIKVMKSNWSVSVSE